MLKAAGGLLQQHRHAQRCVTLRSYAAVKDILATPTPAGMFDGKKVAQGDHGQKSYRLSYQNLKGDPISPWHDVRLQTAKYGVINALILTPKQDSLQMAVATKEENTPVVTDVADGKVAQYAKPVAWNMGVLPQTWLDPNIDYAETGCPGDATPIGIVDIGTPIIPLGDIVPVKPLGILPLKNGGKTNFRIICINMADPLEPKLQSLEDVEAKCPGVIGAIKDFVGGEKEPLDRVTAERLVSETFDSWRALRFGDAKNDVGVWTKTVSSWTDGL